MAWAYLFLAATFEVVMGLSLKLNQGWTRPVPSVIAVLSGLTSIYLLALSMRSLPVGTAYAIWTGTGAVGLVVIGIWFFNEPGNPMRLLFLALTFIGIMGLRFTGGDA